MTGAAAAPPRADSDSAPFWQALADHRVVLQRCPACARHRFPPMPSCPYCPHHGAEPVEVPGTGVVYSWVRVERPMSAAMADEVPYCIVTVDLDGGSRMFGRLEGSVPPTIGLRVVPVFTDHPDWTELRFTVAPESRTAGSPP